MAKKNIFIFGFVLFFLTSCFNDGKYEIRDGKVVWTYWTFSFGTIVEEVVGADTVTFKELNSYYGKDKYHAYYQEKLIEGAQPETFKPVKKYLSKDANDFYWRGMPVNVYDMATFKVFYDIDNDASWAKDSRYAYRLSFDSIPPRFRHTDYKSFEPVGYVIDGYDVKSLSFAKDKNQVYFHDIVIKGADVKSFRQVDYNTAQDKNGVYYGDRKTVIKDYSTIQRIGEEFTDRIYLYDKELNRIGLLPDSLKPFLKEDK